MWAGCFGFSVARKKAGICAPKIQNVKTAYLQKCRPYVNRLFRSHGQIGLEAAQVVRALNVKSTKSKAKRASGGEALKTVWSSRLLIVQAFSLISKFTLMAPLNFFPFPELLDIMYRSM